MTATELPMQNELLQRFARDRSPQAIAALIECYRPLVYSVCRRYLRRREDVEDAAQETFLKLARHAPSIHGSVPGWLTATAHTTSLELIRRATREHRRR